MSLPASRWLGPVFVVVAATLWAVDGVLRRSLYGLPPITIIFFEHLIGAALLFPIWWQKGKQDTVTSREWSLLGVIAMLSGVLGTVWFTTALLKTKFIAFSIVYLIAYLEPIFAISTAAVLLKEKVSKSFLLWAGVALVAAYFATFKNGMVNLDTGTGTIVAALFALGSTAAWGVSTTFSKLTLNKLSVVSATWWRFVFTSILALVGVVVLGQAGSLGQVSLPQLGRLLVIALSTGMIALYLYYQGLQRTEAKVTTMLELVFPVLAVSIDAVVYNSVLSVSQYVAAAVLVAAMYKVARLNQGEPMAKLESI